MRRLTRTNKQALEGRLRVCDLTRLVARSAHGQARLIGGRTLCMKLRPVLAIGQAGERLQHADHDREEQQRVGTRTATQGQHLPPRTARKRLSCRQDRQSFT